MMMYMHQRLSTSSPRTRGPSIPGRRRSTRELAAYWIPAFAGMTGVNAGMTGVDDVGDMNGEGN
jgi:hypothetical protein